MKETRYEMRKSCTGPPNSLKKSSRQATDSTTDSCQDTRGAGSSNPVLFNNQACATIRDTSKSVIMAAPKSHAATEHVEEVRKLGNKRRKRRHRMFD